MEFIVLSVQEWLLLRQLIQDKVEAGEWECIKQIVPVDAQQNAR